MSELLTVENLIALATLASLEIVLGIDNIVFIAILAAKLPPERRDAARRLGIGLSIGTRLALLFGIAWIVRLTEPLFAVAAHPVSGKDLVMIGGGLFLLAKATYEIHHRVQAEHAADPSRRPAASFGVVITQIVLIDVVFSLDSVITAVGMAQSIAVMVAAVLIAVVVMLAFSGAIVRFIERHPAIKILALAFLLMIGGLLVAEGFHYAIPKGYVYFAMAFSLMVELLQMRAERPASTLSTVADAPTRSRR